MYRWLSEKNIFPMMYVLRISALKNWRLPLYLIQRFLVVCILLQTAQQQGSADHSWL